MGETGNEAPGITIYPPEYFCPVNYITKNTRSIHWYGATWKAEIDVVLADKRMHYITSFGEKNGAFVYKIATIPIRLKRAYQERGFIGTLKFAGDKIRNRG